jgi:hypothetical protein
LNGGPKAWGNATRSTPRLEGATHPIPHTNLDGGGTEELGLRIDADGHGSVRDTLRDHWLPSVAQSFHHGGSEENWRTLRATGCQSGRSKVSRLYIRNVVPGAVPLR